MFDEIFGELAQPGQRSIRAYWCGVWQRLELDRVADVAPALAVCIMSLALRQGESVAAIIMVRAVCGIFGDVPGDRCRRPPSIRAVVDRALTVGPQCQGSWSDRLIYVIDALTVAHMLRMAEAMGKNHEPVYAEIGCMSGL